jgi:phospholipid/cholesterol/gamma-HCH transport system substrate-binding protein
MRRIAATALGLLALGALVALPATGADDGPYRVRAVFDNGGFVVEGEEVRIAGARAGTVESVDVSRPDEVVSLEDGPEAIPGKAVVVLAIDDEAFRDFREDASCIIRPASLIGEKYVDCVPTQPRAPGSEPPPELEQIGDGERGEGQRLLPLENNGKAVDLDLIQNINRMPYRDRFRLILNDLGAGLAARGDDLGEIIDRANPALRQTNRVLGILASQNRALADLAVDGDRVLESLARNRTGVSGFIRNAAVAGDATAERGADLEEGLQKLPRTLREVRLTMGRLGELTDQGTPLFTDLNRAAPHLSKATQKLPGFTAAAIPSFETLGDAAEAAGPKLVAADPVLQDLSAQTAELGPAARSLAELLDTFVRTNGARYLMDFIYYTTGTINGFDSFGRYLRSNLQVSNCINVSDIVVQGCEAFFQDQSTDSGKKKKKKKKKKRKKGKRAAFSGTVGAPKAAEPLPAPQPPAAVEELPELDPDAEPPAEEVPDAPGGEEGTGDGATEGGDASGGEAGELSEADRARLRAAGLDPSTVEALTLDDAGLLLDFLLGEGP